ncbi:MAG: Peptidase [Blastococcus sp.]|jgi:murein DD-endopeptidase MepM/ murein hydrolase activator NlpD|nr:Peptidase [Blastococcus sp.]
MRARLLLVPLLLVATAALAPLPAVAGPSGSSGATAPAPAQALWTTPVPASHVTRPFQPPQNPFGAGHRGVDLSGSPRTQVLAAGDGVVVFAGMVAGRPVVSIDHADGLRTTYEPVDPSVAAGTRVTRGSPIGTLAAGHDRCPVSACLHWGLRRGQAYLDPMTLLRPPRVRLLPWR